MKVTIKGFWAFVIIILHIFISCSNNDIICEDVIIIQTDRGKVSELLNEKKAENISIISITYANGLTNSLKLLFSDNTSIIISNGNEKFPYIIPDGNGYWRVSFDGRYFSRINKDNKANFLSTKENNKDVHLVVCTSNTGYYTLSTLITNEDDFKFSQKTDYKVGNPIIYAIVKDFNRNVFQIYLDENEVYEFDCPTFLSKCISEEERTLRVSEGSGKIVIQTSLFDLTFPLDFNSEYCKYELKTDKGEVYYSSINIKTIEKYNEKDAISYLIEFSGLNGFTKNEKAFLSMHYDDGTRKYDLYIANLMFNDSNAFFTSFVIKKDKNPAVIKDVAITFDDTIATIHTPYIFDVTKLIVDFDTNAAMVKVGNVEQQSGCTYNNFTNCVKYDLYSTDGRQESYYLNLVPSYLPVVMIDVEDGEIVHSKTDWQNISIRIVNKTGNHNYDGTGKIKGRGNSSWTYPKKPYSIKLDVKSGILGMPKDKRWTLLANYVDKTLLRNDMAFEIARCTDLAWTPHGQFVELVLNGEHVGNYYLCEKVKIGKDRVNICDDEKEVENRGYLMEIDNMFDETYKFYSSEKKLPFMFKDPDVVNEEQINYIQGFITKLEKTLYTDSNEPYDKYIDIDSWIDYWLVFELTQNYEPTSPRSVFVHKEPNGKLKAGPVWDFDCGTFRKDVLNEYRINNSLYYDRLFKEKEFVNRVKVKWDKYKIKFSSIPSYIREKSNSLTVSQILNFSRWPIGDAVNNDVLMTYDDAIHNMIEIYEERLKWLDKQISNY